MRKALKTVLCVALVLALAVVIALRVLPPMNAPAQSAAATPTPAAAAAGVGVAAADCAGAFIGGSTRSAMTTASASTSATHKTVLRAFRISPHPR